MKPQRLRGRLSDDERALVRSLLVAGRRLRATTIPNADLVDAMVALDATLPSTYLATVALRAFARYVGWPLKGPKPTPKVEAYGVRGFKNAPWRRTFKDHAAFAKWANKQDANIEVLGVREIG